MRKAIIVAGLLLSQFTPVAALADTQEQQRYTKFHRWVYYPTHVLAFVFCGPVIVITSVVQNKDDRLKREADASVKGAPVPGGGE